ncbi:MAG: DUF692 domain-containing protein [Rhodanobacteraceae bacterium]|jgi:hypothetical protein|nr:DUF692 domain-containing protein [Rhodanobacteraceae bacterium]MBL0042341.1 DUF692 domain-containing protein [Xanthomonadales bacterium]
MNASLSTSALAPVAGAGLGLRRGLLTPLESVQAGAIDFMEVAPENWIGVGGRLGRRFRSLTERYPFSAHGLSLSIGGPELLDETFLLKLRRFLDEHGIASYSEHLSYCSDHGHLYDLMPMPFTRAAVHHCAARIRQVQDVLGRRIAIENVSFYTPLAGEMSEREFVCAVLEAADCDLLLDVNNVHVNSVNHRYDPVEFIRAMPAERVSQFHVAGHYDEAPDLIVDTHGAAIIAPVFALLAEAYRCFGAKPTLLERDFNFPPIGELVAELDHIRSLQAQATRTTAVMRAHVA